MKEEIKSMREILDRLESAISKKEQTQAINLGDGFTVILDGRVYACKGYPADTLKRWFEQGNWFPTRKEAEKENKRRDVIQKMRGFTNGFVPDWGDNTQVKVCIYFDHSTDEFSLEAWKYAQGTSLFEIYFRTEKDAQNCIDAMGDEIRSVL